MMAAPIYLADTSAYIVRQRHPVARQRFDELLTAHRLAACQMTALEFLNNAANLTTYETLWHAVQGQRWLDVNTAAMERALDVHRSLAAQGQHRHFSLPDLIIAAVAETNGATVLHYDADYDRIAAVTGQPTEWLVARGSV